MATAKTKTTTKKTAKSKAVPKEKLSKLGQWRRDHPEGAIEVIDPAVLYGLSIYEI